LVAQLVELEYVFELVAQLVELEYVFELVAQLLEHPDLSGGFCGKIKSFE
jgi:coenzyme F420-reducing hydrogenase alpha subunit